MRARLLKPGFFLNERLAHLPYRARLLFAGLWLVADREGRLEDRPDRIRAELFPYAKQLNVDGLLSLLGEAGQIVRYEMGGRKLICVPKFNVHQHPHPNEAVSALPPCFPDTKTELAKCNCMSCNAIPNMPVTIAVINSGDHSGDQATSGARGRGPLRRSRSPQILGTTPRDVSLAGRYKDKVQR